MQKPAAFSSFLTKVCICLLSPITNSWLTNRNNSKLIKSWHLRRYFEDHYISKSLSLVSLTFLTLAQPPISIAGCSLPISRLHMKQQLMLFGRGGRRLIESKDVKTTGLQSFYDFSLYLFPNLLCLLDFLFHTVLPRSICGPSQNPR